MVDTHVPFERRFASPSEERLKDPDYLSIFASQESGTLRWNELLQCKCVVILGEGKCGKTHEFKIQHQKLREEGKFSFFVPLELLHDGDFLDTVTEEEEHEFGRWLEDLDSEAIFFLDAVDELKLRKGTLRKALRNIKQAIKPQAHRARFFISCRPNDWFEELDLGTVSGLVSPRTLKAETTDSSGGEDVFSAVISREKFSEHQQGEGKVDQAVKVLSLLPLTRKETVSFAELYAPKHAKNLEEHLEEKELWHLYQLPADIISALLQLESEGRLGNLEEQLSFGISQKLREVSDKKRNSLSEKKAMEGAERIALSLFLMKRRSIYLQIPGGDAEGVGVADVLADWPQKEQIELLGKSLFDPTGVGAVRFHHRSTQEFLAAQRLKKLRATGLATSDLFNLFFADIGDEKVVIPSMEPVVAWMALWYQDILAEVKNRNPLLLFRQGLPALLSLDIRSELIVRFVEKFAGSEWRNIGVGLQELKRVTTSELAPIVHQLWEQAYTGHDTRELLLELIYLTPMSDCTDLAFQAAFDKSLPSTHRIYAAWAVLKCGTIEQVSALGKSIVEEGWPESVVRNILPQLLPEAINVEGFIELSLSLQTVPRSVHGLGYALLQSVKSSAITKAQKVTIRNSFTQAVWENRLADSRVYQAHSRFDHVVDSVVAACFETVPTEPGEIYNWAWSLAVGFHFGERRTSIITKDETKKLHQLLSTEVELREGFFWACFDIAEVLEAPESDWHRFVRSDYDRSLRPFTHNDFSWLLQALSPEAVEERRGVAFYVLSQFVIDENHSDLVRQVSNFVSDRADLSEELAKAINPPVRESDKYEIEHIQWQEEQASKEVERISGWKSWRKEVLADEYFQLDDEHCENTLYNLYNAIQKTSHDNARCHWDSGFVETAFSKDFLEKIREKLSDYWKNQVIHLFSERPDGSKNRYELNNMIALFAAKCSAENGKWAASLNKNDAVQAARISTLELNGFASFITQIEVSQPSAVIEVIIEELQQQLGTLLDIGAAPMLNDILHNGTQLMREGAAVCITLNLPIVMQAIRIGNNNESKHALDLVASHGTHESVVKTVTALKVLINDLDKLEHTARHFCVHAVAKLDLLSACDYVLTLTKDLCSQEMREHAVALFAAIFGDRHGDSGISFDCIEPTQRLEQLKKLVIRAYQAVKPNEDEEHEGCYTPNIRDDAEYARSFLLECLVTINSPRTLSVVYELSSLPEFAHLSDRLKQMATELAARISEPEAMNASNFRKFDQELQYLPYDTSSLFSVMNNRLADFEHHLINDEQSIVDTLRKVDGETELRRFISYWMNQNSRGAYTITQEAVVVSEKRTDIRLHVGGLDRYASIELKLDDTRNKWSGTELRIALEEQLVGRYLNHERSHVGCLLIGMRESRKWEHPDTGKRMDLKETVNWLQGIANEIMEGRSELRVSVKGIDYSLTANE